jgi:hypothetical protein
VTTLGLVCSSAGGLEHVAERLVRPLLEKGWSIAVTVTPTAMTWLEDSGDRGRLEELTGYPVRHKPRLPREVSPHPPVDCFAVVPATSNTVAKLALGLADNQALTSVSEAIGSQSTPVVMFPRINALHAAHPAWDGHIAALRSSGVSLVYGEDVWPLHQPGTAPQRELPWQAIIAAIERAAAASRGPLRKA